MYDEMAVGGSPDFDVSEELRKLLTRPAYPGRLLKGERRYILSMRGSHQMALERLAARRSFLFYMVLSSILSHFSMT